MGGSRGSRGSGSSGYDLGRSIYSPCSRAGYPQHVLNLIAWRNHMSFQVLFPLFRHPSPAWNRFTPSTTVASLLDLPPIVARASSASTQLLLERLRVALVTNHYSPRTQEAYVQWILRYERFHDDVSPSKLGEAGINSFLSFLATDVEVSASTQNQALAALLFVYRNVLDIPVGELGGVIRAKKTYSSSCSYESR